MSSECGNICKDWGVGNSIAVSAQIARFVVSTTPRAEAEKGNRDKILVSGSDRPRSGTMSLLGHGSHKVKAW